MKRKKVSSQLLTKADLESALEKYATKGDLKTEIRLSADEILTKVDENAQKYRDQILTSNDKLAKQLETMREELGLENLQMKREVEDHEKRITNLEKIPQIV